MTEDLAKLSLGYTEQNKISLTERRANYASWLKSSTARPVFRVDDGPPSNTLANKRARAEQEAAGHLINPIPDGAIVRTDEGEKDPNVSDDIRIGFGKALLVKAEGASPETAALIANAAEAMLGPIVRADDKGKDEDVDSPINGAPGGTQPKSPKRPGSSPLNRRDPAFAGRHSADDDGDDGPEDKERRLTDDNKPEPTMREVLDALKGIGKRLDAIEKKDDDDDDDDADGSEGQPTDGPPRGPEDGTSRALAADSSKWRRRMDRLGEILCRPDTADVFSVVQARADKVYGYHGQQADKPLYGETLNAYRRRLLNPFLQYSPAFRHSDLRVLSVDPAGFKAAEETILADAEAAARNPKNIPMGYLRQHEETRGGHTYTRFFGNPKSWMGAFAPHGRRVKRIDQQNENGIVVKNLWTSPY